MGAKWVKSKVKGDFLYQSWLQVSSFMFLNLVQACGYQSIRKSDYCWLSQVRESAVKMTRCPNHEINIRISLLKISPILLLWRHILMMIHLGALYIIVLWSMITPHSPPHRAQCLLSGSRLSPVCARPRLSSTLLTSHPRDLCPDPRSTLTMTLWLSLSPQCCVSLKSWCVFIIFVHLFVIK